MENPRVWFRSISLENVRSFGRKQTIYFTEDGTENGSVARWNVLLGDNGTGKTTVLKGLCLIGTKDTYERQIEVFAKDYFNGRVNGVAETRQGELIDLSGNASFQIMRDGPIILTSYTIYNRAKLKDQLVLFGYGASRRSASTAFSQEKVSSDSVSSLFDEQTFLINPEAWLLEAELAEFKNGNSSFSVVKRALEQLFKEELLKIESVQLRFGTRMIFQNHYGRVKLHDLSLGYKTLIAWMVDFAKGLLDRYPDSPDPLSEPAVCLVDEIDLHLHPKFQRNIIKFLTDTFPNTQFIVTAHSPLVVQAAEDYKANLIVLKREGDETVVTNGLEVRNWRIDQILSSDLFEGIPARAPQQEERMQRRRELLLKDELSESEQAELDQLDAEFSGLSVLDTQEAFKALDLIYRANQSK